MSSKELWLVMNGGPTLGGVEAIFDSEYAAERYARLMNMQEAFSPTATKDRGISRAWLMGDGRRHVQKHVVETHEEMIDLFNGFDWESESSLT